MERVPPPHEFGGELPPAPSIYPPQDGAMVADGQPAAAGGGAVAACVTTPMTMMLPFGGTGGDGAGDMVGGLALEHLQQHDFATPIPSAGIPDVPSGGAVVGGGSVEEAATSNAGEMSTIGSASGGAASGNGGGKGKKGKGKKQGPEQQPQQQWQPTLDAPGEQGLCEHNVAQLWQHEAQAIAGIVPEATDFKLQEVPMKRVKKIMKQEEEVEGSLKFMIASEGPIIMAKACELFVLELSLRAWHMTVENRRCTVQRLDVAQAIVKDDTYDFLIDIVPRDQAVPPPSKRASAAAAASSSKQQQRERQQQERDHQQQQQQQGRGVHNGDSAAAGASAGTAAAFDSAAANAALGGYPLGFGAAATTADGLFIPSGSGMAAMMGVGAGNGAAGGVDADVLAMQQMYLYSALTQQQPQPKVQPPPTPALSELAAGSQEAFMSPTTVAHVDAAAARERDAAFAPPAPPFVDPLCLPLSPGEGPQQQAKQPPPPTKDVQEEVMEEDDPMLQQAFPLPPPPLPAPPLPAPPG